MFREASEMKPCDGKIAPIFCHGDFAELGSAQG
jgi:hypothetical protein